MFFNRILACGLLMVSAIVSGADQVNLSLNHSPGERYMDITLRGTLRLDGMSDNGISVGEMSGLAWSEQRGLLYAVGNDGNLFHIKPVFNDQGMLTDARLIKAVPLLDRNNRVLAKAWSDSEGLALIGQGKQERLLISFEDQHRIDEYDTDGHWLATYPLPKHLTRFDRYYNRNRGMEAVTLHPALGILSSTEVPMLGDNTALQIIYGIQNQKQWRVERSALANASVVGMEVSPDGDLILLERSFDSVFQPIIISVYRIELTEACSQQTGPFCNKYLIARFNSNEGWNVDNFEGLSRAGDNGYFMVSDNNRLWLQKTLLSYFSVDGKGQKESGGNP